MTDRDYIHEMRQLIDQVATGEYIAAVVAGEIVEKLEATDPDLLRGWLEVQASTMIHHAIIKRDSSRRTAARIHGPRSVFAEAAAAHETGERGALIGLLQTHYVVDTANLRKPLASMNRDDLSFVSGEYEKRAIDSRMESAFFAALARKVGSGVVADHFTEDKLREMRSSLRG